MTVHSTKLINMLKRISILIISVFLLQSCKNGTGTYKNEDIDRRKREEIKALNDKLFKAIENKDLVTINTLLADTLKKAVNVNEFVSSFITNLKLTDYKILDEYNVIDNENKKDFQLRSDNHGVNDYEVKFVPLNKEIYTSLIISKDQDNEFLMLVGYGKYGEAWKINMLYSGQYRLFGKTAPEYYEMAKKADKMTDFVDAFNYSNVAFELLKIKPEFFQFKDQKQIAEFFEKASSDFSIKYPFPLKLDKVSSGPEIYAVTAQISNGTISPKISYKSTIPLNDEEALKRENESVKAEIGKVFTGVDQNKKYIFYMVSNEFPERETVGEQYGFVDTLKTPVN